MRGYTLVPVTLMVMACGTTEPDTDTAHYAMDRNGKRAAVAITYNEHTGATDADDLRYVMHRLGRPLPARTYYLEASPTLSVGQTQWRFDGQGNWVLEYAPSGQRVNRAMFLVALQNAVDFRPPPVLQPSTLDDAP